MGLLSKSFIVGGGALLSAAFFDNAMHSTCEGPHGRAERDGRNVVFYPADGGGEQRYRYFYPDYSVGPHHAALKLCRTGQNTAYLMPSIR